MKRLLSIAVAVASANLSLSAIAEDQSMEHVIVSVPIHKQEADTALPITIITGDELRRQAASTIGETLSNRAGIANSTYGPGVGRPVIRGQQGPRAIPLQNNVLSADVSSLSPDHAVTVEALLADSIEVLRGPATLLYGGGAIGGVVNVIDNRIPRSPIDGLQGAVEYRYNDASDMDNTTARIEGGNGRFAFHFSGTHRETDDLDIPGFAIDEDALEAQEALLGHHDEDHDEEEVENTHASIANTDSDTDAITGGFSVHFGDGNMAGFSVSHMDNQYGLPPGTHEHNHEEEHAHDDDDHDEEHEEAEEFIRIDMEQTRYDAMLHLEQPAEWVDTIRGFLTYTDYEHKELEGSEVGTLFTRETWETRVEVIYDAQFGNEAVFGLQARVDEFEATGAEGYVPKTDSTEVGLFLIEDFHRGAWTYEAGLRVDLVERDPDSQSASEQDFTNLSASGSALWQFTENWQLGASLSRSARAPATEELFSNIEASNSEGFIAHPATGVIEVGNANLDEEVSLNLDLALQWHSGRSWAEISLFYNNFEDYIFLINSGEDVDEVPVYLYQQEDAKFVGIEFESSFHLTNLGAGSLFLDIHGDAISGEFDKSGDVPRLPPLRISGKLSWSGDAFSTWVSLLEASDQKDSGNFETETDGYTRWDLGADYRFQMKNDSELLVFMKWKNIGDKEIRLSTSFLRNYAPSAGESVEAGVRYTF
jgi:iron complex outermembrane recepter protein